MLRASAEGEAGGAHWLRAGAEEAAGAAPGGAGTAGGKVGPALSSRSGAFSSCAPFALTLFDAPLCDRLTSFYQTEWDKVHQTYQEEADKCRVLMEKQVGAQTHEQTLLL